MEATLKKTTTPGHDTRRRIFAALLGTLTLGFWWCDDCERVTERIEDDHGQPAHCSHCGSHNIHHEKPLPA
jgi:hypothetical protein